MENLSQQVLEEFVEAENVIVRNHRDITLPIYMLVSEEPEKGQLIKPKKLRLSEPHPEKRRST